MIYYEFTASLQQISTYAFRDLAQDGESGLINRDLASACPNLTDIGMQAFSRAFKQVTGKDTVIIPGSVTGIGQNGFRYNGELGITTIQLGTENNNSALTEVGSSAFLAIPSTSVGNPYKINIYTDNTSKPIWAEVKTAGTLANGSEPTISFITG